MANANAIEPFGKPVHSWLSHDVVRQANGLYRASRVKRLRPSCLALIRIRPLAWSEIYEGDHKGQHGRRQVEIGTEARCECQGGHDHGAQLDGLH